VAAPAELWKLRRDVVGSIGMGSRGKLSDRAVRLGLRTGLTRKLASLRVDVSFAFVDALLVAVAYSTALILRFVDQPEGVPLRWWIDFRWTLPVIVAVHVLMNVLFGTYGHVWEHASIAEATRLVFASLAAGSLLLTWVIGMRAWLDIAGPIPVGSLVLGALLTVMLTGVVRFRTRLFSFNRHLTAIASTRRVLIVGTGQLAATLARHRVVNDKVISVVGFVATDEALHERRLAGLPILGTIETLPDLVRTHDVDEVIVATADGAPVVRRLIDVCLTIDVRLRIVPDIGSVLEDHGGVQDVRDLEPEDLLERPPVHTDLRDVAQTMAGKRVLVTGAGGSIGSELVKQILALEPAALLVLDHDEPTSIRQRRCGRDTAYRSSPSCVISVTVPGCSEPSPSHARRSCSTPPPTSTSRFWKHARRRRSRRTSSVPSTYYRRAAGSGWSGSCSSRQTKHVSQWE
jgi:hypothetical protein